MSHFELNSTTKETSCTTESASASHHSNNSFSIQRKPSIGREDDPLEHQAESIADSIMQITTPSLVQKKCSACEKEKEQVHRKGLQSFIQRKETSSNKEVASESVTSALRSTRGSGGQMSDSTQTFMENRFGVSFSDVRIHTDGVANQMATEMNAQAFTVGKDVYFNESTYSPETLEGKHLLAHELTHVVQQNHSSIQRSITRDNDCEYQSGEVNRSHSSSGLLSDDVIELGDGRLLISDFGVDWRHVNANVASNPVFRRWDALFASDDSYRIEIIGYTDCVGNENKNTTLRQARARNIENLLSAGARQRVTFRGMAGLGQFVVPNTSQENRAKNRGVIIRFSQQYDFEEEEITSDPRFCGPNITSWLVGQMNSNRNHPAIRTARETQWPRYVPFFNLGWTYGFLSDFRDLVRAGGVWDFKSRQGKTGSGVWRAAPGRGCPSTPCDRTVTMCGTCFNYDVPGNIHYGYVGVAAGLRPWFLHNRADAAQAGGVDDPKDAVAIDIGIRMYTEGTTLCDELNTHRNELNLDRTEDCNACTI